MEETKTRQRQGINRPSTAGRAAAAAETSPPATTMTSMEVDKAKEKRDTFKRSQRCFAKLLFFVMLSVQGVVWFLAYDSTYGRRAHNINFAAFAFHMWACPLVFALMLAHASRSCFCKKISLSRYTMVATFITFLPWWVESVRRHINPQEGGMLTNYVTTTTIFINWVSPVLVILIMQVSAAALRAQVSKTMQTSDEYINAPGRFEADLHDKLVQIAFNHTKRYLVTVPVIYVLVLSIMAKTHDEPRLREESCNMYHRTFAANETFPITTCSGCHIVEACSQMVESITLPDVPTTVDAINLDNAVTEMINFSEWRIAFLEGAQLSYYYFFWLVIADIRDKQLVDVFSCRCAIFCCFRFSCCCIGQPRRKQEPCVEMRCRWETWDKPHVALLEVVLALLILGQTTVIVIMESLSLDVMAYKEMMNLTRFLYEMWMYFCMLAQIVIICLSCQTRCAQEETAPWKWKNPVRGHNEYGKERTSNAGNASVAPISTETNAGGSTLGRTVSAEITRYGVQRRYDDTAWI